MLTPPLYNERSLLLQLAAGQEKAFDALYQHYHGLVHSFIQKFVKSPNFAEDLAQEVFIKIWNHHKEMAAVDSFRAFLLTTTRNHTLDFLKRAARLEAAQAEILRHAQIARSNTSETLVLQEYLDQLRIVYERLPEQTQRVFALVKGEGKSYEEVAAILGISRTTVKKHIVRSNKAFKGTIENELGMSLSLLLLLFFRQ